MNTPVSLFFVDTSSELDMSHMIVTYPGDQDPREKFKNALGEGRQTIDFNGCALLMGKFTIEGPMTFQTTTITCVRMHQEYTDFVNNTLNVVPLTLLQKLLRKCFPK